MDHFAETAPAKINLSLSVTGKRPDGFHDLESLVVFAPDICDRLYYLPGNQPLELTVSGPFAAATPTDHSNLVMQAVDQLTARYGTQPKGHLKLEKHLPVEAGLGGGSSDAAACLRLFSRYYNIKDEDSLIDIAARLGSDIPACIGAVPACIRGRGENISPLTGRLEIPVVLVNPLIPLSTARIFGHFDDALLPASNQAPQGFATPSYFYDWLDRFGNDLTRAATDLCPEIKDILKHMHDSKQCRLARMSGSGATCFGLFETPAAAEYAAQDIKAAQPDWWVQHGYIQAPCL